ncbi:hypothetical protein, partial [[Clostridium] scindens]|uniref:hypothetical protein n=1 Tax=Clostridium scindens (strain JCM 10418 / VPI 12708) TaxID=29347 RepID=UPI001AA0EAFF
GRKSVVRFHHQYQKCGPENMAGFSGPLSSVQRLLYVRLFFQIFDTAQNKTDQCSQFCQLQHSVKND